MEVCITKITIQIVLHLLMGLHAFKIELRHKTKDINPQKNEVRKEVLLQFKSTNTHNFIKITIIL